MAELFNRLPGFQKTPAGQERQVLRRLPRILAIGTLLLCLPSLAARTAASVAASSIDLPQPASVASTVAASATVISGRRTGMGLAVVDIAAWRCRRHGPALQPTRTRGRRGHL